MSISNYKSNSYILFIVLCLSIFIKCVLFHYFCFDTLPLSCIFSRPLHFFNFYFNKILPALIVSSFVFIVKRRWWIIPITIIIDLWFIANLLYFRSYSAFMDVEVIKMAGNLDGATSSILPYINWKTYIFIILSIFLFAVLLFCKKSEHRHWGAFSSCMIISILLGIFNNSEAKRNWGDDCKWEHNCFERAKLILSQKKAEVCTLAYPLWIRQQTPLHYFPAYFYMRIGQIFHRQQALESLSTEEMIEIENFICENNFITPPPKIIKIFIT